MRHTITHRGIPIASAEADTIEQLGCVIVELLPAFDGVRHLARDVWKDPNAAVQALPPDVQRESLDHELELYDANGAWLPTKRIEVWITGPKTAVAFVDLDHALAPVPARTLPPTDQLGSAKPEV